MFAAVSIEYTLNGKPTSLHWDHVDEKTVSAILTLINTQDVTTQSQTAGTRSRPEDKQ